jgi:hypothetical protein
MYNLTKQTIKTYKSLRSFSVFVSVAILHSDRIYHEAISIKSNTDIRTAINHNKVLLVFSIYTTFRLGRPSSGPANHEAYIVELSVVDSSMYANIWYNTPQWHELHPKKETERSTEHYVCLYSCLRYLACKSHRLSLYYTVICGLSGSPTVSHINSKTQWFFRTNYWTQMCVLIISATFVWNISHSKKNSERYHKFT